MIRVEHPHHARNPRLNRPSARIARKADRARRRAVIRAITREDLVASGEKARDLDGVLVGFRAAVRKEEGVNIARSDLCQLHPQPRPRFRRHERIGISQRRCLLRNGLDDPLIAVSNVHRHQLAVEVDEALPFRRPEINALSPRHRDGIDFGLRRPLIQCVFLSKIDHLLAGHGRNRSCCSHKIVQTYSELTRNT